MIDDTDDFDATGAMPYGEDADGAFSGAADLADLTDGDGDGAIAQMGGKPDLNLIMDIPVTMQVVLGTAVMPVSNLVKLGRGAVVKLNTTIGDPVDLIVNGRIVARGEVVVLESEESRFGITLTEIVSPGARPQRSKTSGA